jgi:hypothetical protein
MAIREIVELVARVTDLERRVAGVSCSSVSVRCFEAVGSSSPQKRFAASMT